MKPTSLNFPFTAVFGQSTFKLALILAAINPSIGGVLVCGPRGLAKSTLARGFANILPAENDTNTKPPFVTLPLGATEEMLVGTLNLEHVLEQQKVAFKPGILARADRGILYVDEVNLLADNLVDLLLDVSASGVNVVERDGISQHHSARFLLLGTMNPDEGELRPQILDRFGLFVSLENNLSVSDRIEIVKLREAFDQNPESFQADFAEQESYLRTTIVDARKRLPNVTGNEDIRTLIAQRCHDANVDGVRADIVWYKTARAYCALQGRLTVTEADVDAVQALVLHHRRNTPDSPPGSPPPNAFRRPEHDQPENKDKNSAGDWGYMEPVTQAISQPGELHLSLLAAKKTYKVSDTTGRQADQNSIGRKKGNAATGRKPDKTFNQKVNWFSTLTSHLGQWPLTHFKYQKARLGQRVLNIILLDTSASVLKNQQFGNAKAIVLGLAKDAYIKRELLTLMGFGNQSVEDILPQRRAPKNLRSLLNRIPASGGTPIREALQHTRAYQNRQFTHFPNITLRTFLLTDGKSTQSIADCGLLGEVTVIDLEDSAIKRGKAEQFAAALNARYFSFSQLATGYGAT